MPTTFDEIRATRCSTCPKATACASSRRSRWTWRMRIRGSTFRTMSAAGRRGSSARASPDPPPRRTRPCAPDEGEASSASSLPPAAESTLSHDHGLSKSACGPAGSPGTRVSPPGVSGDPDVKIKGKRFMFPQSNHGFPQRNPQKCFTFRPRRDRPPNRRARAERSETGG